MVASVIHGRHSWFHHYSVLYRDSIFNVQYLARVIYSSLYLGTPADAYRFVVCYIQSIVVDGLYPIDTLVRSEECACIVLYFVIYVHDRILADMRWNVHGTMMMIHIAFAHKHITNTTKCSTYRYNTCERYNDVIRYDSCRA